MIGNQRINPNACTAAEQRQNWANVERRLEDIEGGSAVDNYTVQTNSSDVGPTYSGADYLYDKIADQTTYVGGTHQLVYAEPYDDGAGHLLVRLFTLAAAGAGTDDKTVLVSGPGTDTTNNYLFPKLNDHATYASGKDQLVAFEIVNPGGNETVRAFWDVSTATGYSATVTRLFACVGGNTRFIDLDFVYSEIWTALTLDGLTFDAGVLTVDEHNRIIRGQATSSVGANTASFTIDNVEPLANGLDPSLGNSATTITVYNVYNMRWDNNEWVEAAWNPDTSHWETLHKRGTAGTGGTDNLWVCQLSSDLAASTPGTTASGTGTIYQIGPGGVLTDYSTPLGGAMAVHNPFTCVMPASNAQYPCAKTYSDPDDPTLDEWTITGPDMMAVLYRLTGAGAAKSLAIPEDGSGAADIQWMGGECVA